MGLLTSEPGGFEVEAKQVAMARYSRTGFEAAALTAIGIAVSGMVSDRPGLRRTA